MGETSYWISLSSVDITVGGDGVRKYCVQIAMKTVDRLYDGRPDRCQDVKIHVRHRCSMRLVV